MTAQPDMPHPCHDKCPLGRYALRHPDSLIARLWRWHTGWCPGYRRNHTRTDREKDA